MNHQVIKYKSPAARFDWKNIAPGTKQKPKPFVDPLELMRRQAAFKP